MTTLRILSGGAAQGLVGTLAPVFERDAGCTIAGTFGAVGAMAAKLRSGDPTDLVILTSGLIAELAREGHVQPATAVDLGTVETGVAVRGGDPEPAIGDLAALREALAAADEIYLPDPHQSTAGIHFAKVLRALGLWDGGQARLRPFPNGATAMRELARSTGKRPLGCTQITEILITPGVTLVGPLPRGAELSTVYTSALAAGAEHRPEAEAFAVLLTDKGSADARLRAGFR
jgi:molybdate transport system substrate-binding protein